MPLDGALAVETFEEVFEIFVVLIPVFEAVVAFVVVVLLAVVFVVPVLFAVVVFAVVVLLVVAVLVPVLFALLCACVSFVWQVF